MELPRNLRPLRPDPMRDWVTMLTFGGIVLASLVVYNIWLFERVANGGIIGGAATSTVPLIDPASVSAIEKLFYERSLEASKYLTGTYRFTDPSQ